MGGLASSSVVVVFLGILFLSTVIIFPCETWFLLWFVTVRGVPGVFRAKASRLWMVQIKLSHESRNWFDQHPLMLKMRSSRNKTCPSLWHVLGRKSPKAWIVLV